MIRALVNWAAILLSLAALFAAGAWLAIEATLSDWTPPPASTAEEAASAREHAFRHGPIGLETLPLKYAAVLGTVSGPAFGLAPGADPWAAFGFIANPSGSTAPACAGNAADWLPVGLNVTNYLPASAAVTPLQFAGLTCASCHSGRIRRPDGSVSDVIYGMGNPELDVIAFTDGVRNAVLDPTLTADRILDAYAAQCPKDRPGPLMGAVERFLLSRWIDGFRDVVAEEVGRYDLPAPAARLRDPAAIAAGPGRTRPFRSVVRVALRLPGEDNHAYSKIPAVFEQDEALRPRSQYDGSIADPVNRAFIAAYASGATPVALSKPEMSFTIAAASAHTEELGLTVPVARLADLFPDLPAADPAALAEGFALFRAECASCHGFRDPETGSWVASGERLHQFIPVAEIGTSAERVSFPHGRLLPLALWTALPAAGADLDRQRARLDDAAAAALAAGRPGEAWLWSDQRRRLDMAARQFRRGHPLAFPECERGTVCDCAAEARGPADPAPPTLRNCALTAEYAYFANPVPQAWLRAPYLHNGSVPTLRQLVNLEDRPARFCRGRNLYDPAGIGLLAPGPGPDGACPADTPFLFDTGVRGNSNRGHDYPWSRAEVQADPAKAARLEALMLYLRTL
jgi:mono/diheme cytochrome c family protein